MRKSLSHFLSNGPIFETQNDMLCPFTCDCIESPFAHQSILKQPESKANTSVTSSPSQKVCVSYSADEPFCLRTPIRVPADAEHLNLCIAGNTQRSRINPAGICSNALAGVQNALLLPNSAPMLSQSILNFCDISLPNVPMFVEAIPTQQATPLSTVRVHGAPPGVFCPKSSPVNSSPVSVNTKSNYIHSVHSSIIQSTSAEIEESGGTPIRLGSTPLPLRGISNTPIHYVSLRSSSGMELELIENEIAETSAHVEPDVLRQNSLHSVQTELTCASIEDSTECLRNVQADLSLAKGHISHQAFGENSQSTPTDNNSKLAIPPTGEGAGFQTQRYCFSLCQCPCRNCAVCPLRMAAHPKFKNKENFADSDANYFKAKMNCPSMSRSRFCCRSVLDRLVQFCQMEAENDPTRYHYDSKVIPVEPLSKSKQKLLEITEFPFLILWIYFTYWAVIVSMTASKSSATVWLSAAVAGLLVGIGLNANAYKSVTVPRRRGSIRHHRHARALLELQKYGESVDGMEMKIDWGIVTRFFLIPFGVSSLSGLVNSDRENFLLVFPKEPYYLVKAILCPAAIVTCLAILRVLLLWKTKVRWSLQVLFLNGALVD